jgi:hypothetical protein
MEDLLFSACIKIPFVILPEEIEKRIRPGPVQETMTTIKI